MKSPQLINEWLKERGSTQTWLAKKTGCDRSALNTWLHGRVIPIDKNREALAEFTKLDVADKAGWE